MKILIIDNNLDRDCWGSPDLCRYARLAPGATVSVRRAPQGDLPSVTRFGSEDRILVSGSKESCREDHPWIGQLGEFIRKALDRRIPYLGVCFGHQMLARALNEKALLGASQKPEFGWTQIHPLRPCPLLDGISGPFYSFSSHFEEVTKIPIGMLRVAQSQDCAIQAMQHEQLPAYGIQFHPEKSLTEAQKILKERIAMGHPKVLLHPDQSEKLFNPQVGERVFQNFFRS